MVALKKPWLLLPPEAAHNVGIGLLKLCAPLFKPCTPIWNQFNWRGIQFQNRLGVSGGVDKNAEILAPLWAMGAGFIEVGTVTPKSQGPNPGTIMMRDNSLHALWNKMGFPNDGVEKVAARLKKVKRPYPTPLFINIGKNRDTPNTLAAKDYTFCIQHLEAYADAFVVNISSPNTSGLRELLEPHNLMPFLKEIKSSVKNKTPILLKLSPDMTDEMLQSALNACVQIGIDGWILTNTTITRTHEMHFPNEGGVSGKPLAHLSQSMLEKTVQFLGKNRENKLLISAGGVMSAEDVQVRLKLGADLVQVYTALVFEGPLFFKSVGKKMQYDKAKT